MKVVKAAAQVLNTLWQYRELRSLYKQVSVSTQMENSELQQFSYPVVIFSSKVSLNAKRAIVD